MASPMYPETSWVDLRLEKRSSSIHGIGVFANQFIQAGERLVIAGGIVFTPEDWQAGNVQLDPAKQYNEAQIGENLFLAMPIDEDINYWFNHSCDPNFWGDVARHAIQAGAEITTDYALSIADEDYCLEPCQCGFVLCRRQVTGNDWKLFELQDRYRGQFGAYIERRIQQLNKDQ